MRTRSRTLQQNMKGSWSRTLKQRTNCAVPSSETVSHSGGGTYTNFVQTHQTSTITDQLSPAADQKKKREWRRRQAALRNVERGYALRQFMPNHPCTHVTHTLEFEQALVTLHSATQCSGYNRVWTSNYDNSAIFCASQLGGLSDPATQIMSQGFNGTSSAYRKHDWYALTSEFNEACDSFIPSSMLLGETMYEHGIFVDALKYVINPSRAIKDFLNGVVSLGLKKKNLGTIARIIKGSSNAWLSYNFGVKPAIEDTVKALTAHQIVQQRLWYLSNNGGSYVPIRVRRSFDSSFTNTGIPTSYPIAGFTSTRKWYISKTSSACIGAWGKVRDDLNWKDAWTAYLQHFGVNKVIGLAWELIPFSFVLDWFTNAQERINELTRFRIGDPFSEIRNLSCSLTEETKYGYYCLPGFTSTIGAYMVNPTSHFLIARGSMRNYSRYLTIPETSGVVDFSSLGLFQAIASGALLVQRAMR